MKYDYAKCKFNMLINFYCPCCGIVKRTMFATSEEPYLKRILDNKAYDEISNCIIAVADDLCEKCYRTV